MIENNSKDVFFYFGAMGSAKTAQLLMRYYHYKNDNGMNVVLLKPSLDNRYGETYIESRTGLRAEATAISDKLNILDYVLALEEMPQIVMVDEVQFLSPKQIEELKALADYNSINIETYGLKNNFKNRLFGEETGTIKRLLELATNISEIKSYCVCGNPATDVARYDPDTWKIKREGPEILIGGNNEYVSLCYRCWSQDLIPRPSRVRLLESRIVEEGKKGLDMDMPKINKYRDAITYEKKAILQEKLDFFSKKKKEVDGQIKILSKSLNGSE